MTLEGLRDASVVLLAIEAFVFGLVPLLAVYFAVRGLRWVDQKARPLFRQIRQVFTRIHETTQRVCGMVTEPVLRAEASWAAFRHLRRRLLRF